MLSVRYVSKQHEASDVYTFHFRSDHPVRFIPGQFIELTIPHTSDGRGERRWFTLSSTPSEVLAITTRIVSSEPSSYKRVLSGLSPGIQLKMASPMGDFVLPKDPGIPLTFVAGGIGVTPFRSIIKSLIESDEKRDVRLLYSVSERDSAVFMDVFEQLGDQLLVHDTSKDGRVTAEDILQFSRADDNEYFYISGPEPMVENLEKELMGCGIKRSHLHGDFFPGYMPI